MTSTHVLVIHDVADMTAWKVVFDRCAQLRRDAGEREYQVLESLDRAGRVVHFSTWTSAAAARAFFESPELVAIRQEAGVSSPEFHYLRLEDAGVLG